MSCFALTLDGSHATFNDILYSNVVTNVNKKVILVCTDCQIRNYSTNKNQLTSSGRLHINKYCKHCKKHTQHKETK